MFIRIKKINNKEYAYLVENKWRKRRKNKVRQKTLKYLGKVYKLEKTKNKKLGEFLKISNLNEYLKSTIKKITLDLIKLELHNHNFKQSKNSIFEKNNFYINLTKKQVIDKKTKKQICLEINKNFLCSYTLRKLLNFSPKQNLTKLQIGKQLANTFEQTGILVSKEIFVVIAQRILKETEK